MTSNFDRSITKVDQLVEKRIPFEKLTLNLFRNMIQNINLPRKKNDHSYNCHRYY